MNSSNFRLTLDLHSVQSQYAIPVMVGDTNVTLLMSLTDGGVPYVIEDGCLAKISIKRPTGTHLEEFCTIKNKAVIEYPFSKNKNTCAVEGIHECDVTLYGVDGERISSPRFTMVVSPKVIGVDDVELSDSDYTAVQAMIEAEAARVKAETERVNNEEARLNAGKVAIESAESARKSAESAQESAKAIAEAKESGEFDGVSCTHEWNGTTLTVTSASGTSSADLKGEQGEQGKQGEQGEPGADGKDYVLTSADKAEIVEAIKNQVPLVKSAEQPTFVNSIDEMANTNKVYVMPDGYMYAFGYVSKIEEVVTNIDTTFKSNIRVSTSSGAESASSGCFCTDFIDISTYQYPLTIHFGGVEWYMLNSSISNMVLYNENKERIDGMTFPSWKGMTVGALQVIPNTDTNEIDVIFSGLPYNGTAIKYIRATAPVALSTNAFVSASYTSTVAGERWFNTGHAFVPADYEPRILDLEEEAENHEARIKLLEANEDNSGIPEYWLEELESKANTIQRAMESAGHNKSAFLWYTDAHWQYTNAKVSPLLLQYLIKNTSMNKVNFGGDIVSDPSELTYEQISYVYEWRKMIRDLPNHHSVIGNHDNHHKGRNDADVSNMVYSFLIAPEESADMVMGDDFYYYIDNPCEKTRYLYLDSGRFSLNDDETKFIIDSLTSVPNGWHIVVISHIWFQYTSSSAPTVGSINGHMQVVLNLLDAYNARESGSVTMSYVPHSYDFSACGGKVEFCIGGHIHVDHTVYSADGIPVIITASDTNQERSGDETEDSGTMGTTTESAVFGIIADYNNSKITVVGVGRGTSREISY